MGERFILRRGGETSFVSGGGGIRLWTGTEIPPITPRGSTEEGENYWVSTDIAPQTPYAFWIEGSKFRDGTTFADSPNNDIGRPGSSQPLRKGDVVLTYDETSGYLKGILQAQANGLAEPLSMITGARQWDGSAWQSKSVYRYFEGKWRQLPFITMLWEGVGPSNWTPKGGYRVGDKPSGMPNGLQIWLGDNPGSFSTSDTWFLSNAAAIPFKLFKYIYVETSFNVQSPLYVRGYEVRIGNVTGQHNNLQGNTKWTGKETRRDNIQLTASELNAKGDVRIVPMLGGTGGTGWIVTTKVVLCQEPFV